MNYFIIGIILGFVFALTPPEDFQDLGVFKFLFTVFLWPVLVLVCLFYVVVRWKDRKL